MERAGESPVDNGLGITWRRCPVTRVDLSSTVIRERVRQGRSIRHLVPDPVRKIIVRDKLYATQDEPSRTESGVRHAS